VSYKLVAEIKKSKTIPGRYKRTLEAWASFATAKTLGDIFPSKEAVAQRAGTSRWTVYRHLEVFTAKGILVPNGIHTFKDGHWTTKFRFDLDAMRNAVWVESDDAEAVLQAATHSLLQNATDTKPRFCSRTQHTICSTMPMGSVAQPHATISLTLSGDDHSGATPLRRTHVRTGPMVALREGWTGEDKSIPSEKTSSGGQKLEGAEKTPTPHPTPVLAHIPDWNQDTFGIPAERLRNCLTYVLDYRKDDWYRVSGITLASMNRERFVLKLDRDTPPGWTPEKAKPAKQYTDDAKSPDYVPLYRRPSEFETMSDEELEALVLAGDDGDSFEVEEDD
jgi:hypothetical protein